MRFRLAFAALAAALALPLGSEAAACLIMMTADDETLTPRERREREESLSRDAVRLRLGRARATLAAGGDPGEWLAAMLVPNARPVPILYSNCGPMGESDLGEGRETFEDWLAGTPFAGREDEFARILRDWDGELPGRPCNEEMRGRFADHLRRRLTAEQLEEAFLFLGARWPSIEPNSILARQTSFAGRERRPPLVWTARDDRQRAQIVRWTRLRPAGRALQQASDDFWRETAPLLGDLDRTCPVAAATWVASKARLLALIEAEAARRAQAQPAPPR